ncbi:OpgC domain-containing protein [Arthrobacter sp. AOP36-A1-22]|uniref:OpgC domain-containing protein n=1 Tax=Arthrobacter sp. AOP36-A1-22 TaxID=3457684 RepID=UPI004034F501
MVERRSFVGGRDRAIDVVRGYCIASMVTGHVASSSVAANVLHIFPNFDGASGFVLLSGLVLGIVQSKRMMTSGFASVRTKTFRRAAMIYLAQLILSIVGVAAVILAGWRHDTFPPALGSMSYPEIVAGIMTMNIAPPGGDVLRLYVVFLLLAPGVYWLLAKGKWLTTLCLSLLLAGTGYTFPFQTSFSLFGGAPSASWAAWQLLFVSAIILGWYWRPLGMAAWIKAHSLLVFLSGACITVLAGAVSYLIPTSEWMFNKYTFPPGRIAVAYAVVASLYVAAAWLLERLPKWTLRPVYMVGQKSLDAYVIQSFAVVLCAGVLGSVSTSIVSQMTAVAVLISCWAWAELRLHQQTLQRKRYSASSNIR